MVMMMMITKLTKTMTTAATTSIPLTRHAEHLRVIELSLKSLEPAETI
jgi:hypothetical protein